MKYTVSWSRAWALAIVFLVESAENQLDWVMYRFCLVRIRLLIYLGVPIELT